MIGACFEVVHENIYLRFFDITKFLLDFDDFQSLNLMFSKDFIGTLVQNIMHQNTNISCCNLKTILVNNVKDDELTVIFSYFFASKCVNS